MVFNSSAFQFIKFEPQACRLTFAPNWFEHRAQRLTFHLKIDAAQRKISESAGKITIYNFSHLDKRCDYYEVDPENGTAV